VVTVRTYIEAFVMCCLLGLCAAGNTYIFDIDLTRSLAVMAPATLVQFRETRS
jgi:hypothetical protein